MTRAVTGGGGAVTPLRHGGSPYVAASSAPGHSESSCATVCQPGCSAFIALKPEPVSISSGSPLVNSIRRRPIRPPGPP
jgi:hypothetical protein